MNNRHLPGDKVNIFRDYPYQALILMLILGALITVIIIFYKNQKKYTYIMSHDNLTGIPNKMWAYNEMVGFITSNHPFGMLLLSLNKFKNINDKLGRDGGDIILKLLVDRLSSYVSKEKKLSLARYGGDEFIVIIDSDNKDFFDEVCRNLCKELDKPFIYDDGSINLSYSICVVAFPEYAQNEMALQKLADAGIKKQVATGQSGYIICDDAIVKAEEREKQIIHKLNEAIINDGFKLLYQAKYNVEDRTLYGFEALLRMEDGYANPGEFIRVAEENRLMIPIGRKLTEIAVRQMANWKAMYAKLPVLSINFSTYQLFDEDYPEFLLEQLRIYDVPVDKIIIEVTESASLSDSQDTREYLRRFTDNGIKLSIDDFGTGYSSISYLNNMKFSELKIDKSLLDQYIVTRDATMISTIIAMAHNLGCHVVAEGVEVEDQAVMLKEAKGDIIQGYLLGKPEEAKLAGERIKQAQ